MLAWIATGAGALVVVLAVAGYLYRRWRPPADLDDPAVRLETARRAVRAASVESRRIKGQSLRGKGQGGDAKLASDAMDSHGGPP